MLILLYWHTVRVLGCCTLLYWYVCSSAGLVLTKTNCELLGSALNGEKTLLVPWNAVWLEHTFAYLFRHFDCHRAWQLWRTLWARKCFLKQLDFSDTLHWKPTASHWGGAKLAGGGKQNPEWISINELWHFLETVSRRQKSIFTTALCWCFVFWPQGFFCFSFLPNQMPPLCSRALVIWQKCLLACERDSPDHCPGWGTGTSQAHVGQGSLAELPHQRCGKAAPLNGQLQTLENGPFFGRDFAVPDPIPRQGRWVQQCSSQCCMPLSAVVPNGSHVCSSLHITLVLGTVPTMFSCSFGPAACHPGEVLWALFPVLTRPRGWRPSPFFGDLSQIWEVPVALGLAGNFLYRKACLVLTKSRLLMFICSWNTFWRQ